MGKNKDRKESDYGFFWVGDRCGNIWIVDGPEKELERVLPEGQYLLEPARLNPKTGKFYQPQREIELEHIKHYNSDREEWAIYFKIPFTKYFLGQDKFGSYRLYYKEFCTGCDPHYIYREKRIENI